MKFRRNLPLLPTVKPMARILLGPNGTLTTGMAMAATDVSLKTEEEAKTKSENRLDMAFAIYLATGRFASPSGIVFVQHNYLPTQYRRQR